LPPEFVEALINYKCTPFPKQAKLPAYLVENHKELCDDLTTALSAAEVVAGRSDERIAVLQDRLRREFETKGYITYEVTDDEAEDDVVSVMALQKGPRGGGRGKQMKRAKGSRK
jgi:UDP:flavonoid glycosyltransferase YjiC (YdhE family)